MMKKINKRHGGPYDRGSADGYYGREPNPHYFVGETYSSAIVEQLHMSKGDIALYMQGYSDQVESGVRKYNV
jgi:hypothetical protein